MEAERQAAAAMKASSDKDAQIAGLEVQVRMSFLAVGVRGTVDTRRAKTWWLGLLRC